MTPLTSCSERGTFLSFILWTPAEAEPNSAPAAMRELPFIFVMYGVEGCRGKWKDGGLWRTDGEVVDGYLAWSDQDGGGFVNALPRDCPPSRRHRSPRCCSLASRQLRFAETGIGRIEPLPPFPAAANNCDCNIERYWLYTFCLLILSHYIQHKFAFESQHNLTRGWAPAHGDDLYLA